MQVSVTGSFLEWKHRVPLERQGHGWSLELQLPRGHHEFAFIVDDTWALNTKRFPTVTTRDGERRHVLHV